MPENCRTWLTATSMLFALSGPLLIHRLIAGRTAAEEAARAQAELAGGGRPVTQLNDGEEIVWHGRLCVAADLLLLAGSQLVQLIPDGAARLFACLKAPGNECPAGTVCHPVTTPEAVDADARH
jgi:hypothetical protein